MTDALKALADKVEAGTLTYDDCLQLCDTFKGYHGRAFEAFEGSLDAAKALMDAVLPGWGWRVDHKYGDGIPEKYEYKKFWVSAPGQWRRGHTANVVDGNEARAWLLAILRALQSEG